MIWTIIIIIVVMILGKFILSLSNDQNELENQDITEKFETLLNILNNKLFEGRAFVTKIDKRSFNLGENASNKIIQFFYSTGNLNITFRTKQLGEEITCPRDYNNLRHVSKQKQENIGLEFSEYVFKKIEVYKKLLQSNLFKDDESNAKLTLSNAFYSFCFNKDTAANILGDNDKSQLIVRAMKLSLTEGGYVLKTVLNGFLKNRFQIELDFNKELQNFRGCSFSIQFYRLHFLSVDDTYIELFKHNIKDVKNSIGDDVQVAEQFILYIQESIPTAIFVVTFDPVLKYSVRRLFEDGDSTAIYFFKENDDNQALEFIEQYILQTTFN